METCLTRFVSTSTLKRVAATTKLIESGSMDSFAAVRLTARLEFELGVALPPTLVLVDAPTPRQLAKALFRLAVADPSEDRAPEAAEPERARGRAKGGGGGGGARSVVSGKGGKGGASYTPRCHLRGTDSRARSSGARARVGPRPGGRETPRAERRAAFSVPRDRIYFSPRYDFPESERAAHARFFEWRARVAPAQVVIGVVVWLAARAFRAVLNARAFRTRIEPGGVLNRAARIESASNASSRFSCGQRTRF